MSAAPLAALVPVGTTHTAESVALGDVIAGKYRLDRLVGAGGMAHVFEATHLTLEERVAVKVLAPSMVGNEEAAARFLREARAAAKMRSEHAARVFDVGALPSGSSYMVMEYLRGRDLEQLVLERTRLSVDETVDFLLQACEALAEAHAAGVVHRDLKPANLFLTCRADGSPCIKVIDFGISKATHIDSEAEIITVESMGSPPYISPEQLQSAHDVDARTDIWSLGCCMYELLAGVPPFEGEPLTKLWHQILDLDPRPLGELVPGLPAGLEAIVLRCLAKRREDRFQDVRGLVTALASFAPERGYLSVSRVSGVILTSARQSIAPSSRRPFASGAGFPAPSDPIAERRSARPRAAVVAPAPAGWAGVSRSWWLTAVGLVLLGGVAVAARLAATRPAAPLGAGVPASLAEPAPAETSAVVAPAAPPPPPAPEPPTQSAEKRKTRRTAPIRPREEGLFNDRK